MEQRFRLSTGPWILRELVISLEYAFNHYVLIVYVFSESVLALQAPSTTKCDFCQVSFCGIGIPGRCVAVPLASQHPHGLSDLSDLIQCGEVYDCFDHNSVEVDIMFDYLAAQNFTPRHIYRDVSVLEVIICCCLSPLVFLDCCYDSALATTIPAAFRPGFIHGGTCSRWRCRSGSRSPTAAYLSCLCYRGPSVGSARLVGSRAQERFP